MLSSNVEAQNSHKSSHHLLKATLILQVTL
jgi:hypothetical protein